MLSFSKILLVSLLMLADGPSIEGLSKQAMKKVINTIENQWPASGITYQPYSPELFADIFLTNCPKIFSLKSESGKVGYLLINQAFGKFDFFTYMVLFSPDLKILGIELLEYREDYGGEIGSKKWLKQFVGKSSGMQMELGKDIQGISGATISCRSITAGIQLDSKGISILQSKGILTQND